MAGFRNAVASYTVSLLHERVIADMGLHARGLKIIEHPAANFLPAEGGRYLKMGGGLARSQAEVAKFSAKDSASLPAYYAMLDGIGDVLRVLAMQTPPNLPDGLAGLPRALRQGNMLRGLGQEQQRDLLDLFIKSARDVLDSRPHVSGSALGGAPILGNGSYRAPIKGLYMCVAGTYPGGGVSGMPGSKAACEILRDQTNTRK